MTAILSIDIDGLARGVFEASRVEFKTCWDEKVVLPQVMKTICAFANDFQNLSGGYLLIGVAEEGGQAQYPPKGLAADHIEGIQKQIRGQCERIEPKYQPIFSPEIIEGRHILVIWAPAGDTRPYQLTLDKQAHYYVRLGVETVEAKGARLTELMGLTARVPFDDRRALGATMYALSETQARRFYGDIGSALAKEPNAQKLFANARMIDRVNGHHLPKNVALLFFSNDPTHHGLPGAYMEIANYTVPSGDVIEETVLRGPLFDQLKIALNHLRNHITKHLHKEKNRAETTGWDTYPFKALEEALVNAVYHRSYEPQHLEPTKIHIHQNRIEIISYPGPQPGLDLRHFQQNADIPTVPARNRRVGELLKDMRLAEARYTGIGALYEAMAANGSPPPRFDFDQTRSYFRVVLPVHEG